MQNLILASFISPMCHYKPHIFQVNDVSICIKYTHFFKNETLISNTGLMSGLQQQQNCLSSKKFRGIVNHHSKIVYIFVDLDRQTLSLFQSMCQGGNTSLKTVTTWLSKVNTQRIEDTPLFTRETTLS